ncbi:MauE/DoxX family redox-associated membrane protein [Bacillus velezensis]
MISLPLLLSIILANLFISTGISKISKFKEFKNTVVSFTRINNIMMSKLFSIIVIVLELILPVLLFIQSAATIAALGLMFLLIVFNILIISNIKRNNIIKCSCGGVLGSSLIGKSTILRNCLLILALGIILWSPNKQSINTLHFYNFVSLEASIILLFAGFIIARKIHNLLSEEWESNAN